MKRINIDGLKNLEKNLSKNCNVLNGKDDYYDYCSRCNNPFCFGAYVNYLIEIIAKLEN